VGEKTIVSQRLRHEWNVILSASLASFPQSSRISVALTPTFPARHSLQTCGNLTRGAVRMDKGWAQFHGRAGAKARLERNSRDDLRTLSHPDDGKHAAPTYKTRFRALLSPP